MENKKEERKRNSHGFLPKEIWGERVGDLQPALAFFLSFFFLVGSHGDRRRHRSSSTNCSSTSQQSPPLPFFHKSIGSLLCPFWASLCVFLWVRVVSPRVEGGGGFQFDFSWKKVALNPVIPMKTHSNPVKLNQSQSRQVLDHETRFKLVKKSVKLKKIEKNPIIPC